jgi:hypothetical protein
MQQHPNSDNVNQYENDFGHQTSSSSSYPNAMDIKQRVKLDELVSRFVSPEPAKNFNYDELVTFVSEGKSLCLNLLQLLAQSTN